MCVIENNTLKNILALNKIVAYNVSAIISSIRYAYKHQAIEAFVTVLHLGALAHRAQHQISVALAPLRAAD